MSKQKLILLVVVIVVIVAFGIILAIPKGENGGEVPIGPGPAEGPEGVEEIEEIVQTPEETKKIMEKIIRAEDISLCEGIENERDRERCDILAEAIIKEDISFCNEIDEERVRMICKDNIVIILAINAKNSSSCERVADKTRIDQCKNEVTPGDME